MRVALVGVILTAALATVPGPCPAADIPDRPLTLVDCAAIALRANPQIASAEQGVVSAEAGLMAARSSYYPQLSLSAVEGLTSTTSFLSLGGGTFGFGGANTREDLDLTARMTFWRRGRRASVAESGASLEATRLDRTSTVQALLDQVAGDYYGVLAAAQLLAVAEAGVESAQGHLEQVKARVALGAAAEVDTFPAEDDLARAQLDLIDARSSVRLALAQLKNSMGVPPETEFELAESSLSLAQEPPPLEQALGTALETRPEVLSGRASVRATDYALAQAKIRRGPLMDLSAQYNQGYEKWESRDPSWNLLFSLSWPLFDGHATKADEIAARSRLERVNADLERLVNQVGLEVETALVEVRRSRERVEASAKSVAAAEARLAAAEGMYQQGRGILLEVIDARGAVTDARASQVRARYDYQIALVGLQRALGTLSIPQAAQP